MNTIIIVLSLAGVALGAPQHGALHHAAPHHAAQHHAALGLPHALHASKAAMFSSGAVATLGVHGAHGWADAHLDSGSAGRGLALDARVAPAGRAAWANDAHLHRDAQPADQILEQQYEMQQPGGYMYSYKTSNGIEALERAALKSEDAEEVQGTYSWVAPSGEKFSVEYVADETGYHAKGAHIPEIPAAIARSLEWNAAHPEEEGGQGSAAMWQGSERAASGRTAWVSKSSANVPAWESSAKIETARIGSASGRSAWNADATTRFTGAGHTQITKITETKPAFATYTASGLAPAARSAWASEGAVASGFTGTGFTGAGHTQITKVTETSAHDLAPVARSAWTSEVSAPAFIGTGFPGTGFTGTGHTQITQITENKPAFAASGLAHTTL